MVPTEGLESHLDCVKSTGMKCLFLITFMIKMYYG